MTEDRNNELEQMIDDETVAIPSQSWYDMVVYDSPPSAIQRMVHFHELIDDKPVIETIERGLDFIGDRYKEGTYGEPDDWPTLDRLMEMEQILRQARQKRMGDIWEPYDIPEPPK